MALEGEVVSVQAASTSVKAPAASPRVKIDEVFMGGSLLDPVLSVTKRDDAAQLGKGSAALLAQVIEVRLRRF